MNFCKQTIIPKDIYEWIDKKENGDNTDYLKGKEDTQEAIDVFRSLYGYTFKTPYRLFLYLKKYLCMRIARSQSFYRSFIVLNNDEIITLRLSQHFATQNSTNSAKERQGKPNVEYHLVISRMQPVNPKRDIYYDRLFEDIEIMVRDIDLAEFNDGHFRKGIIDEIIALLTNGTSPSATNENRKYRKMSLIESRIRNIIQETIDNYLEKNVIRESMGISDEVDELARCLYDMILKDLNQMTESDLCGWKFTKEKLRLNKTYNIHNKIRQDLIDYMHVVGRCYLEGDEPQSNKYGSYYDYVSCSYYTQMVIQMCVKYNPDTGTFELANKFKTNLLATIEHELMHGLQHRHRAINQTTAYINSTNDNYYYNEYKDIKEKIKSCYYFFTPFEIHANVQRLYRELYDANGDIEKCHIYDFYNSIMDEFNDLLKHRTELGGKKMNWIIVAQLGDEMNFGKLRTHCKKGFKKWQDGIRRVMRKYQLENNNEQPIQ